MACFSMKEKRQTKQSFDLKLKEMADENETAEKTFQDRLQALTKEMENLQRTHREQIQSIEKDRAEEIDINRQIHKQQLDSLRSENERKENTHHKTIQVLKSKHTKEFDALSQTYVQSFKRTMEETKSIQLLQQNLEWQLHAMKARMDAMHEKHLLELNKIRKKDDETAKRHTEEIQSLEMECKAREQRLFQQIDELTEKNTELLKSHREQIDKLSSVVKETKEALQQKQELVESINAEKIQSQKENNEKAAATKKRTEREREKMVADFDEQLETLEMENTRLKRRISKLEANSIHARKEYDDQISSMKDEMQIEKETMQKDYDGLKRSLESKEHDYTCQMQCIERTAFDELKRQRERCVCRLEMINAIMQENVQVLHSKHKEHLQTIKDEMKKDRARLERKNPAQSHLTLIDWQEERTLLETRHEAELRSQHAEIEEELQRMNKLHDIVVKSIIETHEGEIKALKEMYEGRHDRQKERLQNALESNRASLKLSEDRYHSLSAELFRWQQKTINSMIMQQML